MSKVSSAETVGQGWDDQRQPIKTAGRVQFSKFALYDAENTRPSATISSHVCCGFPLQATQETDLANELRCDAHTCLPSYDTCEREIATRVARDACAMMLLALIMLRTSPGSISGVYDISAALRYWGHRYSFEYIDCFRSC
jgi:hypothetical protein